ncbi:hypothetical protein CRG98_009090 [Punica granatum]|uniref:ADP-ribosyl cyclase/cyclic ADP-ribose hydrolase n=1 Tax=Punica granatum TaxID=22663 RepID=A0A2I0KQ10_PUNGR|nr:hypothetical protein CRG98_009090 [Punica granatum]
MERSGGMDPKELLLDYLLKNLPQDGSRVSEDYVEDSSVSRNDMMSESSYRTNVLVADTEIGTVTTDPYRSQLKQPIPAYHVFVCLLKLPILAHLVVVSLLKQPIPANHVFICPLGQSILADLVFVNLPKRRIPAYRIFVSLLEQSTPAYHVFICLFEWPILAYLIFVSLLEQPIPAYCFICLLKQRRLAYCFICLLKQRRAAYRGFISLLKQPIPASSGAGGASGYHQSSCRRDEATPTEDVKIDSEASATEYEVMLSCNGCGEIIDCLQRNMIKAGISVFIDDKKLHEFGAIGHDLPATPSNFKIYIPIFSKGYASSAWCLSELKHMVDLRARSNSRLEILPIFYDVKPADVGLKTELYTAALKEHKRNLAYESVQPWEGALKEVAGIKGWELRHKE